MSSSSSEFSGQKMPAKLPEKPSFSQTCSLLSQYLKEKGSFGDLSLGMKCGTDAIGSTEAAGQTATTMDLFPTKENTVTTHDLMNRSVPKDAKSPQLTVFYAGQVIVFDDFPAEKAKEIMSFASTKGNSSQTQNPSVYTFAQSAPSFPANLIKSSADPTASISPRPQAPSRPVTCDLPIMRNASLHRFLEKRKDRIAAKAPYQANKPMGGPTEPVESMPWLGIAANSPQN